MSSIYINEPATNGKICLKTTMGDIDVELWSKECPKTCRNFVQLCMEGYYNGCIFHRLVKNFIVQGGDPTGQGSGGESIYGKPFKDELHSRLRFSHRGLLAMANECKNDNGSQFFFTLDKTPELQGKHTIFGKVVGPTLFNMLKLGEGNVDKNDRPNNPQKIIGVEVGAMGEINILSHPFDDIVPRRLKKLREKSKETKQTCQMKAEKNFSLLSFGDEAEEEEQLVSKMVKKLGGKSKSAHDICQSEDLSHELAVKPDELGAEQQQQQQQQQDGEEGEISEMRMRIREKLTKRGKKSEQQQQQEQEQDLEKILETEEQRRTTEQVDSLKAELKSMQKDFLKALRKPKKKVIVQEETLMTEGRQIYEQLRSKFLDSSKGMIKHKAVGRENQTMELLEKFKSRMTKLNREAVLFDRKPMQIEDKMEGNEIQGEKEDGVSEHGKLDLDAEDVDGNDWMAHKFVAPEDITGVSKAKDANLKDANEDWYDIYDPRNAMNLRRRVEPGDTTDPKRPRE